MPPSQRKTDAARIAILEDAVVAGAILQFGGGTGQVPESYLSEGLYAQAVDIVTNVPRLAGAWVPPEGE